MTVTLLNTVILADDFAKLRDWYVGTFGPDVRTYDSGDQDYTYVELTSNGSAIPGLAEARQMGTEPDNPRNNTALPQLCVDNIYGLFETVGANGGTVLYGPKPDPGGYIYGAFADPEGNQIRVIDRNDG